jgi:hypothetical protein
VVSVTSGSPLAYGPVLLSANAPQELISLITSHTFNVNDFSSAAVESALILLRDYPDNADGFASLFLNGVQSERFTDCTDANFAERLFKERQAAVATLSTTVSASLQEALVRCTKH